MMPKLSKRNEIFAARRTEVGSAAALAQAVLRPFALLCLIAGSLLLRYGPVSYAQAPSVVAADLPRQDIVIELKDDLQTATFADQTDDQALAAAVPSLIAKDIDAINLRGAPIHDLRPLSRITRLRELNLAGTQVRDIAPLAGLTNLRSLNLQFSRIIDLRPLSALMALKTLNLGGTEVSDLSPIARLTDLHDLVLAVTKVRDLAPLAGLRQLVSLDLDTTWVSDLRPLADITGLRFLGLNGTPVQDLRPLAAMARLETLDLGGTQVSDVQALSNLQHLASLNLESTSVSDITPLEHLPALRSVALGGSQVHDMKPLSHLATTGIARTERHASDPVILWNDQTNLAIQATSTDAFEASRVLALESVAVLDTLKSIDGTPAFLVRLPAPEDIPATVAVAGAAHALLVHLFPSRQTALDTALARELANEPDGAPRARALAFGEAMATALIARREEDGADAAGMARFGTAAGQWRPTPPNFEAPQHPQWAKLEPFAMSRADQFRPAAPPALDSAAYREATAQVKGLGSLHSALRTQEQADIARYWSDALGTYAPAGHWNAIAANIVVPLRLGLSVEAELFAELNVAMADASIAMADAKYTYWFWRPITAIRTGSDGQPPDPDWSPLLDTPNHPSYISGHSTFSGAAAVVMTTWFGSRSFTFTSANLPGLTRNFSSFNQAAEEAAASRVYAGIHFPFDNAAGLATGRAIGAWTMNVFQRMNEDRGPFLMVGMGMGMGVVADPRAVAGCALDNVSPVAAITARLDGGPAFSVPVDRLGLFAVPAQHIPAGQHEIVLAATSASGRISTIRVAVH